MGRNSANMRQNKCLFSNHFTDSDFTTAERMPQTVAAGVTFWCPQVRNINVFIQLQFLV